MKKQTNKGVSKIQSGKTQMTQERASAIQSHTAKKNGTVTEKDFAARATAAAARNANTSSD